MKTCIFFLFIISTFSSCSDDSHDYANSKNYIMIYVYDVNQAKIAPRIGNGDYSLTIKGSEATTNDLNNQKYESFAKRFNDVSFNKPIIFVLSQPVLADTITKIDFICTQAFDADHLPNSNINDLINVNSYSLKEYIESGYKLNEEYKIVSEPLLSFNEREHVLITSNISFSFIKKPVDLSSCEIVCIGYRNDDAVFEVSQIYSFK